MKISAMAPMLILCVWLMAGPGLAQVSGGTPQGTSGVDQGTAPNGTGDFTSSGRTFSGSGVDSSDWNAPMQNAPLEPTYSSAAPTGSSVTGPGPSALPSSTGEVNVLQANSEWGAAGIGFSLVFMAGVLIAGLYALGAAQRRIHSELPPGASLGT